MFSIIASYRFATPEANEMSGIRHAIIVELAMNAMSGQLRAVCYDGASRETQDGWSSKRHGEVLDHIWKRWKSESNVPRLAKREKGLGFVPALSYFILRDQNPSTGFLAKGCVFNGNIWTIIRFSSVYIQASKQMLCKLPPIWVVIDKTRTDNKPQEAIFSRKSLMFVTFNTLLASVEEKVSANKLCVEVPRKRGIFQLTGCLVTMAGMACYTETIAKVLMCCIR